MVVEELVTVLGFRTKGVKELDAARKAYEGLMRSLRKNSRATAGGIGRSTGLFAIDNAEIRKNKRALDAIAKSTDKAGAAARTATLQVFGLAKSYDAVAQSAARARAQMIAVARADRQAGRRRRDDLTGSTAIIAPHVARRRAGGSEAAGGLLGRRALAGAGGLSVETLGAAGAAYAAGSVLNKAYQSSMSFERSMIEVGKATDASGEDLKVYERKLMDLARATGKTKEDLASMLSQAGFAGRPGAELMDFTEYAAKATVAWGTSAEETGQALAEIGNIYQADQKRIEQIGDAINTMADKSASRETDLLEFMRRAGASSKQAGMSAESILAFGAAMKEVGVRNEVAATGFEALLNVMKLGEEFSKSAGDGLKELGYDSTKMRKAFVAKPVETMIGLLEKLNTVADPLKKAEIMTNLFGKEYQDDIAKLLNALPKIRQFLALMGDADAIAAKGVRFQFGQNLDKDVSKIDRATQSIDVLLERLGRPIKVQAGGIAEQINTMVDRLEKGDTVAQRLIKRLTGDGDGKGTPDDGTTPLGQVSTAILRQIDPKFGKTADEQAAMDRAAEEAKSPEAQLARRRAVLERARKVAEGAPGIQRDMAAEQVRKSEDEIARLRLQLKRERGDFGLNGPSGKQTGITPGSFGLGMDGTQNLAPRDVPLPPGRPQEFKPKVDASEIDAAKNKATEAEGVMKTALSGSYHPSVDTAQIEKAIGLAQTFAATMRGVASAGVGAVKAAAATPAGRTVAASGSGARGGSAAGAGTMTASLRREMGSGTQVAKLARAAGSRGGGGTNVGGVTVQVAQTNASPAEIGKATGDGVRRGIRSASVVTGGPVAA